MVNSQAFAKRLEEILEYYDLSASAFARRIEVQPSGISHLLSGRNKPSLDFVLKVIEAFPEVELYWLLNGKGHFPSSARKGKESDKPSPILSGPPAKSGADAAHALSPGSREIARVIVCYTDGTFETYQPS